MEVYSGKKQRKFIFKIVIVAVLLTFILSKYTVGISQLSTIQGYGAEYEINIEEHESYEAYKAHKEDETNKEHEEHGINKTDEVGKADEVNEVNEVNEANEKNKGNKMNEVLQHEGYESEEKHVKNALPDEPLDEPVFNGNKNKKQVALTFDDGPDEYFTLKILDILKEKDIKATFFVLGSSAKKYPKVLKHIREKGHDIGNHSWSHKNLKKLPEEQIKSEIKETEKLIESLTESYLPLFRFPYGVSNKKSREIVHSLGYYDIRWSVDTEDWSGITPLEIMKRVEKQLYPGGIILMHCSGRQESIENSVKALPEIIEYVKGKGYEFVTISQLLEM